MTPRRRAAADTIFQPGGGKIVGEIVEEKEEYVAIRTKAGCVIKVPRDEIDRIERGPVPEAPKAPAPAPGAPAPRPWNPPPSRRAAPSWPPSPSPRRG